MSESKRIKKLRELLDARGIQWYASSNNHNLTQWDVDGLNYSAAALWPRNDETRTKIIVHVSGLTPEQAVSLSPQRTCYECQIGGVPATEENMAKYGWVRERICKNISYPPEGFLCSACGWGDFSEPSHLLTSAKYTGRDNGGPNYCPNCGAKVLHDVTVPKLAGSITLENLQQDASEPFENLHRVVSDELAGSGGVCCCARVLCARADTEREAMSDE